MIAAGADRDRELGFMPQLDGLRAFAVMAVLVHHLLDPAILPRIPFVPTWGLLGVRLFFVLSGFLITGILIRARDAIDGGTASRTGALRQFYIRRTLRIFPLYYLVLALALVFGDAETRSQLPWLATYTYNFWIAWQGWYPAHFSHFWSLCVEEQFYLLWPWLVVLAPRRRWTVIAAAMIAAAPLYRSVALLLDSNGIAFYTLTPSSFDALGLGALLAIITRGEAAASGLERRLRWTVLPIGVVALPLLGGMRWFDVLAETMVALVFVWLVAGASRGFGGVGRIVLEAKPILYLGRISYGIYVFHLLVPPVASPLLDALGLHLPSESIGEFIIFSLATIGVASVSWWFVERPINSLKRRLAAAGGVRVARRLVG